MTGPAQADEKLSEVRFLTVAEVAALMRVSKMTVYRLVHGGDLGDGQERDLRQGPIRTIC